MWPYSEFFWFIFPRTGTEYGREKLRKPLFQSKVVIFEHFFGIFHLRTATNKLKKWTETLVNSAN